MDNFKNFLRLAFGSLWVAIPLTAIYMSSCAIATFIENDYGTATAKALIYNTSWFNFLHLYLLVALIGCFITSKAWQRKKYASLFFHSSLIFIILGAGVTRYFGFEGMMHIREGQKSNFILSNETYINILAKNSEGKVEQYSILANLIAGESLSEKLSVFGKPLKLKVLEVQKLSMDKRDPTSKMVISLDYPPFSDEIELIGGIGIEGEPMVLQNDDVELAFSWGVKKILLPFSIALKDFQLDRYPGSMSPSSYASEVVVIDDVQKIEKPFRIFMNNVLDYGDYRFFQSSYDRDEQGTILSVNNDPGKNLTYIGYAILILGSIWLLLDKGGRFRRLSHFLHEQKVFSFFLALLLFAGLQTPSYAFQNPTQEQQVQMLQTALEKFKSNTKDFSYEFEKVLVQDLGGRIKPLNTLATDLVHKITKQDGFLGMNNTQVFLGMMMFPENWQQIKMIKISNPELKKILGISPKSNYIAFGDVFADGGYVLQNYVEDANNKKPSMRNTFDKDVLAVDERINLAYSIYTTTFFKTLPSPKDSNKWLSPLEIIQVLQAKEQGMRVEYAQEFEALGEITQSFYMAINEGVMENQWGNAKKALLSIKNYQEKHSPALLISDSKISSEIFLNKTNFFRYLILPFILVGVILFAITLTYVFKNKSMPRAINLSFLVVLGILTLFQTIALGLRWYISGHAPWSNAYESMLYIAWASAMSAILFFRKSNLAISAASFLAGISLFVANLSFMDPQVSNLVPVLKSYWLNIHVSIITASYGFLGLCFVLGSITLLMFLLRGEEKKNIDNAILSLTAINEMSMILGLLMLTVGNFLGGVWANESWGRYWGWDPKETWALISIGVYGIILHLRFLGFKNMPYIFAASSVVGFFSILMTYFGVNYYLSGMHSYAAGDPLPIPTFVYFLVLGVLALIITSLFKRNLPFPKV
ncbi:cytochrome c biogenesis protein [Helicobacter brantae]|uniref:Cytochrome C biogenesis protein n=1 Tax=Helicobacter brantae TaxID=375927 RepID=A0A3D8J1P7_9HELI|nr:cytochrome c biogenesis protein CcsA [Helicobacter brantae]RDU71126.1 cytochrome C biogenesis protein [Helicobacter brantae]